MKTYPTFNTKGKEIRVTIPGAEEAEQREQLEATRTEARRKKWMDQVEKSAETLAEGTTGIAELFKDTVNAGYSEKLALRILHEALDIAIEHGLDIR